MVDAATGGRAVFGRAIEKVVLGVPQGSFEFVNFDSVDIERLDDENPSAAITGHEGTDRGTPGQIKFSDKIKYSMTPSRILFDFVAMFGKPSSVTAVGGGILEAANFTLTAPGTTGYSTGDTVAVTDVGGGTGAVVKVVASGGQVTGITVETAGSGYVTPLLDFTGIGDGTATGTITATAKAWLVKIRPSATNEIRAATLYLHEGGSYSASYQVGRRAAMIDVADGANKRSEVSVTYADPLGDTIAGFAVGSALNGNAAYQGDLGLKIGTKGRRPYDADFDAGKSLYLKVTAVDADKVTVKAAFDTASGHTDGTGFPSPTYASTTFDVYLAGTDSNGVDHDGYAVVTTDSGPVGLYGENLEHFEVTFGDGSGFTNIAPDDEFEIPVSMPALTKSVTPESRLSAFHLIRKLGGSTDVRIDKGTTKIDRPYKPYMANGLRVPQSIDPTGDSKVTFSFSKRLFDRFFRQKSDAHTRFSIFDVYKVESTVTGTANAHEKVEIFAPQCAVDNLKSGNVSTKNTLEETVTLVAEQPDAVPSAPSADFDASADYPVQINVTTTINPTWLA